MEKIDELIEFLGTDGDPHSLDEISRSLSIPHDSCKKIIRFLAKYGFVQLNEPEVKIDPRTRRFVTATSRKIPMQAGSPPITTPV